MAVPKRKTSKSRKKKRQSANMRMSAPNTGVCPQCHEPKLPHRVCSSCGHYNKKEVLDVE